VWCGEELKLLQRLARKPASENKAKKIDFGMRKAEVKVCV